MRPPRSGPLRAALVALAATLFSLLLPSQASAAVLLSTPYPGITVKPGEKVSLNLEVHNDGVAGIVDLAVAELPEGWEQPLLRGGGFAVSQVFVGADETENVSLSLNVPPTATEGSYRVALRATGAGTVSILPLELKINQSAPARASLSSQLPALQASAGTTNTFKVTLNNESDQQQLFALSAGAPAGWEVRFKPSFDTKTVGSLQVDATSSQGIDVEVVIPNDAPKGSYTIPVTASAGGLSAKIDLQMEVIGRYELSVTTPSGRLSADLTAGRENEITLQVENKGTVELDSINLTASTPLGWNVTFEPETIEKLAPGESRQVIAKVKPDGKALAGDYHLSLTGRATNDARASNTAQFRVTVKTSTLWGFTGFGILLAVGGGLGWVFKTYGRR